MSPIELDALAALVPDGATLALPPDNSTPPSALAWALVRAGKRGLRLIGVPVSGYASDLLIGAGCVASIQTSGVTLGEAGMAPRFSVQMLPSGAIATLDIGAVHSPPGGFSRGQAASTLYPAASSTFG